MTPSARIAALKAEVAATQDAAAAMVVTTIQAMGATPGQMLLIAREYQAVADGRRRSKITGIIARKVAERLRGEAGMKGL